MKKVAVVLLSVLLCVCFFGCSDTSNGFMRDSEIKELEKNIEGVISIAYTYNLEEYQIPLKFELYYDKAPITVTNFVKLVNDKFYDGTYCRNYSTADGREYLNIEPYYYKTDSNEQTYLAQKEVDYFIKGEFSENGWNRNDLLHSFGTMSMIREEGFDTAGAAFMVSFTEDGYENRDGNYAAFGKISVESDFFNSFRNFSTFTLNGEIKIVSITIVDTVDLGEPLKISK